NGAADRQGGTPMLRDALLILALTATGAVVYFSGRVTRRQLQRISTDLAGRGKDLEAKLAALDTRLDNMGEDIGAVQVFLAEMDDEDDTELDEAEVVEGEPAD